VRGHIAAHYRTSSDHCSLTDSHIGQDDTVRSNENISFNYYFSVACRSPGPPIEVGKDRGPKADCAVVADFDVRGMQFINVYKLADPDIAPHYNSA